MQSLVRDQPLVKSKDDDGGKPELEDNPENDRSAKKFKDDDPGASNDHTRATDQLRPNPKTLPKNPSAVIDEYVDKMDEDEGEDAGSDGEEENQEEVDAADHARP